MHLVAVALTAVLLFATPVLAAPADADYFWTGGTDTDVRGILALGSADPRQVIVNLINIALGFLGILAVVIIIFAGFRYMTSGGNEDARAQAKSMLMSAIIGLILIFAAFALAQFLINTLVGATN